MHAIIIYLVTYDIEGYEWFPAHTQYLHVYHLRVLCCIKSVPYAYVSIATRKVSANRYLAKRLYGHNGLSTSSIPVNRLALVNENLKFSIFLNLLVSQVSHICLL